MPFGRKQPQMTGPDYLLAAAQEAGEKGQPYALVFGQMVFKAFSPDPPVPLVADAVAVRPLKDYEASPVSIVLEAFEHARRSGDDRSVDEIVRVGAALLAKWPEYLAATVGHPYFSDG